MFWLGSMLASAFHHHVFVSFSVVLQRGVAGGFVLVLLLEQQGMIYSVLSWSHISVCTLGHLLMFTSYSFPVSFSLTITLFLLQTKEVAEKCTTQKKTFGRCLPVERSFQPFVPAIANAGKLLCPTAELFFCVLTARSFWTWTQVHVYRIAS